MAFSQKMEMRQGQALVMTPQLQQAIKLLQMSNMELTAYVEAELERNPLLERPDSNGSDQSADGESAAEIRSDAGDSEALSTAEASLDAGVDDLYPDLATADGASAAAAESHMGDGLGAGGLDTGGLDTGGLGATGAGGRRDFSSDDRSLEERTSQDLSLKDHLTAQIGLTIQDPRHRFIAGYLVDLVDEAGYCRVDIAEAADRLGTQAAEVEDVLSQLQQLEPAGIMARDLTECMALQLKDRNRYDPMMAALIGNLELVARHDIQGLMRACAATAEDIADMILELRSLNPKPGLAFAQEEAQPVVPDVFIRERQGGSWHVELNTETLPKVLVNNRYFAQVSPAIARDEEKNYLSACLADANWLVKSLDQRARTILKVASEIVRQQDAFFAYGIEHLRPLTLRHIADAIGMHESTVSRVTSNKFVATPRGMFELKYFFTTAIASSAGGTAHAAESVRYRIKTMIDGESPDAILSDDQIVAVLRDQGIDIARRTVAKYREALRIPSSVQRRRLKRRSA